MEDSTELRNLRKRVSTEQDWSFFSARGAAHTPSHDSAAAGSGATRIGGGGGGWQLNPHQSKNELNSKPDTARSESPPPVIVSPWDLSNANRPPSPPLSPTHRKPTDDASPRLHSPQRRLDSPDRDKTKESSPFKVPRSPARKRRRVTFSDVDEIIPVPRNEDGQVDPSEQAAVDAEPVAAQEANSLIEFLMSSIPASASSAKGDRRYFGKQEDKKGAGEKEEAMSGEKELDTREGDMGKEKEASTSRTEADEAEEKGDAEMQDEEDDFLNSFMKAKPQARPVEGEERGDEGQLQKEDISDEKPPTENGGVATKKAKVSKYTNFKF